MQLLGCVFARCMLLQSTMNSPCVGVHRCACAAAHPLPAAGCVVVWLLTTEHCLLTPCALRKQSPLCVPVQMAAHCLLFAFVNVVVSTMAFIPLMLYGLGLGAAGWRPVDAALFGAMLGSTDAVAVTAILKAGG